jgi:hypothetical protein
VLELNSSSTVWTPAAVPEAADFAAPTADPTILLALVVTELFIEDGTILKDKELEIREKKLLRPLLNLLLVVVLAEVLVTPTV